MQYPTNSNMKVNLNIGNGSGIFYDKPVFAQYGGSYTPKYNSKGERNYIKDYQKLGIYNSSTGKQLKFNNVAANVS